MTDRETDRALIARLSEKFGLPLVKLLDELSDLVGAPESDGLEKRLGSIVESASELRTLAQTLADLSRLQGAQGNLYPEQFDPEELLQRLVGSDGLGTLSIRGELGQFQGDHALLTRVMENLLLVGGKGRSFQIVAHREVHKPYHRLVLSWKPGKTASSKSDVDSANVRGSQKARTTKGGKRRTIDKKRLSLAQLLALKLADHYAEAMGGKLRVSWRNKEPTAWTLELPANSGEAPTPIRPVLAFNRDGSLRKRPTRPIQAPLAAPSKSVFSVLLVDDEPAVVQYMTRILELEGFEVFSAPLDDHVSELVQSSKPDLVILSVPQVESAMKALTSEPRIESPVILITEHEAEDLAAELGEFSGISHHLVKPIDPKQLLRSVKSHAGEDLSPILIVDNDESRRGRISAHLEQAGFRTLCTPSESGARGLLQEMSPSLIMLMLDANQAALPELLKSLEAQSGPSPPTIVVLADKTSSTLGRLVRGKATRVLEAHEASEEALADAVRELTDTRSSISDIVG